jgi:hypothetical protein
MLTRNSSNDQPFVVIVINTAATNYSTPTQPIAFTVPKNLLTQQSTFFANAFSSSASDGVTQSLVLNNVRVASFSHLIHWMSTHELNINGLDLEIGVVVELWLAAKRFRVPILADKLYSSILKYLPDDKFDEESLNDFDHLEDIMGQLEGEEFLEELQESATIKTLALMNEGNVHDILRAVPHATLQLFTKHISKDWVQQREKISELEQKVKDLERGSDVEGDKSYDAIMDD